MVKEVHLLDYWLKVLRNIREFQEIAKTEEPELRYILEAIDRTLNNMFIETADEYGIGRFEYMMGIIPENDVDIEARRFKVLTKWNSYTPFTRAELYRRLISICGSEDAFELVERYKEYILELYTHLDVAGAFDLVIELLDEMLPCNLEVFYENRVFVNSNFSVFYRGANCIMEHIRVDYTPQFNEKSELNIKENMAATVIEHIIV